MTEPQLRRLVQTWARRLGLDRWDLEVEIGGLEDSDSYAECTRSIYERATIRFAPWLVGRGEPPPGVMFPNPTPEFIEICAVHELLHLWTRNLRAVIREDCDGLVHPDAYRQLDATACRAEEQLVDGLAHALVRAWR